MESTFLPRGQGDGKVIEGTQEEEECNWINLKEKSRTIRSVIN